MKLNLCSFRQTQRLARLGNGSLFRPAPHGWITVSDYCARTGLKEITVICRIRAGTIPATKIDGKRYGIPLAALSDVKPATYSGRKPKREATDPTILRSKRYTASEWLAVEAFVRNLRKENKTHD